jgi:hypothetical protein
MLALERQGVHYLDYPVLQIPKVMEGEDADVGVDVQELEDVV